MDNDPNSKELQKSIFRLTSDDLHLDDKKFVDKEHIIEVPPPDYQSLKEKSESDSALIQKLQMRCHTLEHIITSCEISPMNQIIKEYKSMSDFYLLQLIKEMEIYRVSAEERSELLDFLHYLKSVTGEIEDILLVEN